MASSVFLNPSITEGTATQSIIPSVDNSYDLGSASLQWRSAYLGTSLILADAGTVQFGTTTPAILSRGAANRLDLASGDSFQTVDGTITTLRPGLGVTSTAGFIASNATAAAAGAQQISPGFDLVGQGWKTNATAASQEVRWRQEVLPVEGAAAPTSTWKLKASVNAGAFTEVLTMTSAGVMDLPVSGLTAAGSITTTSGNNILSGGEVRAAAASLIYWASRSIMSSPADGQWNVTNQAVSAGVGLGFSTDSVLTVSNRAQTGAASLGLGPTASATSTRQLVKKVTGIADNTATDVLTVTIPNANHAATIKLTLLSSNGSTDAFESSRTAEGAVVVARTTGANAVATAATLTLTAIATVAAGATHTLAYSVSAIAGAADASNTFTVQVTIDDTGNLGSNQAVLLAEVINAEATGITIV